MEKREQNPPREIYCPLLVGSRGRLMRKSPKNPLSCVELNWFNNGGDHDKPMKMQNLIFLQRRLKLFDF